MMVPIAVAGNVNGERAKRKSSPSDFLISMEVYPLSHTGEDDQPIAFEIDNVYIGPGTIASLLKAIEGITDVRKEGFGGIPREIHVRFKYQGYDYVAWEPYGDNSRYWIGPDNPDECKKSIRPIEEVFKRYRPSFFRQLLGDILSLRFLRFIS